MIRGAADRAFLPAKNLFEQVGDMMILTGKTIVSAVRPPYPYGGEFMSQFLFALKLCWFPLLISTIAFGYGTPGLQAANLLTLFGAIVAIVCCYKGMTASGGAAGVGRAVNEAVVIAFAGIWAFNYVFTQTLLATHPEILVIK
jgi:ABC-type transporter Mla maintaining outer membrane lipid asymmetry permease subunit MlaE